MRIDRSESKHSLTMTAFLRRARYCGLVKTHLQHLATTAAINLGRLFDDIYSTLCNTRRTGAKLRR